MSEQIDSKQDVINMIKSNSEYYSKEIKKLQKECIKFILNY